MKKHILLGMSILGISCLIFGSTFVKGNTRLEGSLNNTKNAILVDSTSTDLFKTGIDETVYTKVNNPSRKIESVNIKSHATIKNFYYMDGLVHTKESVEVPQGKSLVIQWTMTSYDTTSFFCIGRGGSGFGELWGDMAFSDFLGNQSHNITGIQGYQPDGSAKFFGRNNGESALAEYFRYGVGAFTKTGSGQVGFMGNTMAGSVEITDVSIGYADDVDGTNVTW